MRTASAVIFTLCASFALLCPIPSAVSQGIELPARKPGQWEIKMVPETPGAMPDMTIVACIDAAVDDLRKKTRKKAAPRRRKKA